MRGLLLDFGGVINMTTFELQPLVERVLGLAQGTLTWRGPFEPETDLLWQSMQRGEIPEREYWEIRIREIGQLVGQRWNIATFNRITKCASPKEIIRPQAIETIKLAKARGIKIGLLTNDLELFYDKECLNRMGIIHEFEAIVDATHTNILKPDPEAYRLGLEALGVPAHETLFVDDQQRNIIGAQKVGLQTLFFDVTQPAACYKKIQARLGLYDA
jgi:putative hydrolase of the HAD superfamily